MTANTWSGRCKAREAYPTGKVTTTAWWSTTKVDQAYQMGDERYYLGFDVALQRPHHSCIALKKVKSKWQDD